MYKWLLLMLLIFNGGVVSAKIVADEQKIHKELRVLLNGLENAVNSEKYDDLAQYFHKDMRVTMSNQEVLSSREDIGKFFDFWFGKDGFLHRIEMKLTADTLTELYANKTIGIVRGLGEENTYLSDSRFFPMKTRWTATVIKDNDEKWRILSLHLGVDFLNNPVLSMAKESAKYFALIGGVGGLFLGLLLGVIFWRKKSSSDKV